MKNTLLKGVVGASLLAVQLMAPALDLDLYANPTSTASADLPNVLFIIDNTANWNSAFVNEMAALKATVHNLPENKFNIGIMLATETGSSNSGDNGGYVRAAVRTMNATNKAAYEALIASFDKLNDKGNGGNSGLQMIEVYRYFSGQAPYAGNYKGKADYTGNTGGGTNASNAVYALTGNALASYGATTYHSPVSPGSCAKNYLIYISNGSNQESSTGDATATQKLYDAAGGGTAGTAATATIPISPSGSQSNPMDEWARFMKNSPLAVTTYTIDVDPVSSGQGPGWTALLKSTSGLSNYVAVTSGNGGLDIAKAINDALSKIQTVNSVFAAVSLPASANVQGAYLNQLYIGMFRPDGDLKPRWMGNLKQYTTNTSSLLVDADQQLAIDTQKGFIKACARSFWTPALPTASAPGNYWIPAMGSCIAPPGSPDNLYGYADSPDGDVVEKGAQGHMLRNISVSARTVKTCASSWAGCTALVNFDSSVATTALTGATADATNNLTADQVRDQLIAFAKGQNVDGDMAKTTTEMRPSVHGDVIHSNPLALSYGSDVIVYYGSNDGMLHAVNGNQTRSYGSFLPGAELWAFMPPEFIPYIKRLRDNSTLISITPPTTGTRTGVAKPYGIDGPITPYREGSNTYMYAGMRRGGRIVYAFDISTPASPRLQWRSGCASAPATDCTSGAEGIGQTWSSPRVAKATGYLGGVTPVVIMGGGYDDCEDSDINTCTSSSKGHNVLVLDSLTGAVLTSLPTDRGVVGDVKIVPDANGYAQYGYAADLGGNLYRITIGTVAPSAWTITKIATLGCNTTAACSNNRKFMFAPSVIPELDGSYSLYLGSGDREKPLSSAYFPSTTAIHNYFFKVRDKPSDSTWLSTERGNCEGNDIICLASLTSAGAANGTCGATAAATAAKGWALALRSTEQVVTPAATRFGVTTFSTHMPEVPATGVCTARLGTVHVYNLDIGTAMPTGGTTCGDVVSGGGLPPPPEKPDICTNADCSITRSICVGCSKDGSTATQNNDPGSSVLGSNAKRRVYWYIQK
jgi:type IV pilus assembly protein PilY1